MTTILSNTKTSITFDVADKQISGSDDTDGYNLPAFYSTSKRNLQKAWIALCDTFNDDMTM